MQVILHAKSFFFVCNNYVHSGVDDVDVYVFVVNDNLCYYVVMAQIKIDISASEVCL